MSTPTPESAVPSPDEILGALPAGGAGALTTQALLALLLDTDSSGQDAKAEALADRLLAAHGGLAGLSALSPAVLAAEPGLDAARAVRLGAALALGGRLHEAGPPPACIRALGDVADLLADQSTLPREVMTVVLLDTRHHVVAVERIYQGTVDTITVRVAEVFREAVVRTCPALILAHNHPSGGAPCHAA